MSGLVAITLFGITSDSTLLALAALLGTAVLGGWFLVQAALTRGLRPTWPAMEWAAARLTQFLQRVLPLWFAAISLWHGLYFLIRDGWTGFDAVIYYRGSAMWLAGGDPWSASASNGGPGLCAPCYYAGTPTTVVAFAPFTILPEQLFAALMVGVSVVAAIAIVRALHLAWWWLLFPPLVDGVISANPDIVMLALLLSSWPIVRAVGPFLKVYALIPLGGERRWASIAIFVAAAAATVALWPSLWATYLREFASISARLASQADNSDWETYPILIAVVGLALLTMAVLDRRKAGWLAVPALWPASQFHYSTLALPVITPWLAFIMAVPRSGMPAVALVTVTVAAVLGRGSRTRRRMTGSGTGTG